MLEGIAGDEDLPTWGFGFVSVVLVLYQSLLKWFPDQNFHERKSFGVAQDSKSEDTQH